MGAGCSDWTDASNGSSGAYGRLDMAMGQVGDHLFVNSETCDASTFTFLCINGQRPEVCNRRGSQDGDLLDDSLDPDCEQSPGAEVCDNGIDDDDDGFTDLDDSECTSGGVRDRKSVV